VNLKQLEVFLAIAESGSFSKAAEATLITQSTVSQHISSLEEEFGLRLLDRTGKGVYPTEGGKLLLRYARRILAEAGHARAALKRFRGLEEAAVTIGASNIPGSYMIPVLLPSFMERYPGVTVTVLQGDSRETLNRLRQEEIEIGIVGSRYREEGIDFIPLGSDSLVLAVAPSHPFASRPSVTLEEMAQERFVARESGSGTGKTVREALTATGIEPERLALRACFGSNEALKQAVSHGIGVSFLSSLSIGKELERGELVAVAVEGLDIVRSFYLVRRSRRELSPPAQALCSLLVEMYGAPQD